jgi:sec-independent protein translocase protein TatA
MLQGFTGWHALILLAIVLLLFGATKLPALAKSVGQSMKAFRSEMKTDESTTDDSKKPTEPGESVKDSTPSDKS